MYIILVFNYKQIKQKNKGHIKKNRKKKSRRADAAHTGTVSGRQINGKRRRRQQERDQSLKGSSSSRGESEKTTPVKAFHADGRDIFPRRVSRVTQ